MGGFQVGSSQRRPLQPPIETYTAMQDQAADSSTGADERLRETASARPVIIHWKSEPMHSGNLVVAKVEF